MADRGAYLELCYNSLTPAWKSTSIDDVVTAIRAVGTKHYILASDLGQVHNPPPPEGIRRYIALLLKGGFEPDEIKMMVKDNPERLLGLD
jgi:predicted metal-dependent TIM-barrel fold hydrolase